MKTLDVQINHLRLKSPLMTASGTSGHGDGTAVFKKSSRIISSLGAFVTKGVTLKPRPGNLAPRIAETRAGIINSIGLQNNGVEAFVREELPEFLNIDLPIIVNIAADTLDEFGILASYLSENDPGQLIRGIEINVSCPNIKEGGMAFGVDPKQVESIVKTVKERVDSRIAVITKLTPNITDITLPARAAIAGGTDALSMINTLRGMAIDIDTGSPLLGNKSGGLSGPAIKPVGVFMVYECFEKLPECKSREVPIIGIGGIATWQDAIEYVMAGATAVGIGTAWLVNPDTFNRIYNGIKRFLINREETISDLTGRAHKE
ncbi:MAG: dihydroorotate dehydrogenase [Thermodesulfobacteriota bacterium]|nr:dihydroorotate dehydrogenase [Thermodesulfobacteriota bacterium]